MLDYANLRAFMGALPPLVSALGARRDANLRALTPLMPLVSALGARSEPESRDGQRNDSPRWEMSSGPATSFNYTHGE